MKRRLRFAVGVLLALGMTGALLGCSGSVDHDQANKSIDQINLNIQKNNDLQKEIDAQWAKITNDPDTTEGYTQSKANALEIRKRAQEQRTVTRKTISVLKKAKALDTGSDFKKYLSILQQAQNKSLETIDLELAMTDEFIKYMDLAIAGTVTDQTVAEYTTKMDDFNTRITASDEAVKDLKAKADKLYNDKNLGGG